MKIPCTIPLKTFVDCVEYLFLKEALPRNPTPAAVQGEIGKMLSVHLESVFNEKFHRPWKSFSRTGDGKHISFRLPIMLPMLNEDEVHSLRRMMDRIREQTAVVVSVLPDSAKAEYIRASDELMNMLEGDLQDLISYYDTTEKNRLAREESERVRAEEKKAARAKNATQSISMRPQFSEE